MSLNGALHVGRSALVASQTALQVAGNNMANVATEGFHRRSIHLTPIRGDLVGQNQYVGRGVQLKQISREIDTALQARYRDAISDENAAQIASRFLSTIEGLQGELTDNDLSTLLSQFFNNFSEAANNPLDHALRAVVIEQGQTVADRIVEMRQGYAEVEANIDRQIGVTVRTINDLLDQIALINQQVTQAEPGVGEANALRDQRDLLIDQLSEYMEVDVIEHGSGSVDILVNSTPIVLAGESRGVEFRRESIDGELEVSVRVAADGTHLQVNSGTIGALLDQRDNAAVAQSIAALDDVAAQLVFQVNRLHSQGQALHGFESVTGTYAVTDPAVNLNSSGADLPFRIENGSFFISVTHQDTGQRTTHRIDVDGDAMTLNDLIAEINVVVGVPNVSASIDSERKLELSANAGYEISFSDDSSGALAALGINTFFQGDGSSTIEVNPLLRGNPELLAIGLGHVPGSNGTALAIAELQDVPNDTLGGVSLRAHWQNAVAGLAVQTQAAIGAADSASLVRESLEAQIHATSGVSLDEESINLLTYQRQFQAAARFITVIDEALQILIGLVR